VFVTLGYLLAPLVACFFIGDIVTAKLFFVVWLFLGLALIFFVILFFISYKNKKTAIGLVEDAPRKQITFLKEIHLWKRIGNFILPILFLTFFLNIMDAFYWTIGPLLSERLGMDGERGLFMTTFLLPPLIVGWFVGKITKRLGKKHTAFFSLILGSLFLITFIFIKNPILLILVNFVASFFLTMSFPAINGAYADYMSETPKAEKEIATMVDSFTNLGYIIGPIAAGFSSQYLGYTESFALLGCFGVVVGFILIVVTPKKINIKVGNLLR
ncbi:MAG: MFS transporter, partial [Candidatus Magasanikbacteria bacterium]|nr:MFS transporter [Candidatus Magasanikbacteria bacterium]